MIIKGISNLFFLMFGSKRFSGLEKLCLDAWRNTLNARDGDIIDKQLDRLKYVQRQAAGAKLCFYYNEAGIPLFPDKSPDLNVATVLLESRSAPGEQMKVKIFVHRGLLFSIEFPKRPDRYMKLHGMEKSSLKIGKVINQSTSSR